MFTDYKGVCGLECKHGAENEPIHQFVGPVRIILIEPSRADYWYKKCCPGLITIAYGLLIVLISSLVIWSATFKFPMDTNVHIFLCSMGFHLLLPTGIFILDPVFGPGTNLAHNKKSLEHVILQSLGVLYILVGVFHLWDYTDLSVSTHGTLGIWATWFVMLSSFIGMLYYFPKCGGIFGCKPLLISMAHKIISLVTLVLSVATFCTGVTRPVFWIWCFFARLLELPILLIVICCLYTLCIFVSVIYRTFFYIHK